MTTAATNLFRIVVPRPLVRPTWRSAIPLIVFLLAFGGTSLYVHFADVLLFTRPGAFYLTVVMVWFWWMHLAGGSGMRGLRWLMALVVRLALVGLFIMLLAEPRGVRTNDTLSLTYTLDVSDSIGETALESAQKYVLNTAQSRPQKDQAGLIVFGANAAVELPPRAGLFPFEAINSQPRREATNLAEALSLSAAMIGEDRIGRIVMISDGTQTEGDLTRALEQIKARGIAVDVLPIDYGYPDEVWLERLELPRDVRLGETYEASVILSALGPGAGRLVLRENDQVIFDEQVEYQTGKNRFALPIHMRQPGYYEYTATITPPGDADGWKQNNVAINYLYLKGEGRVLLVTDPAGESRDWELLRKALQESKRAVEVRSAFEFPQDALSLMPYDCVMFVNVPADAFDVMQLEAVRTAAFEMGVGFAMIGGENSYGPGGYHRTAIEKALPVTMDISQKKILPKGALVIVLHTCEFPQGNTWAKRITKQAIKVLGAQDEVGALAYAWNGGDSWLFELTPAGEYDKLVPLINNAQIGDMPTFAPTMKMGLDALVASDAATRHMIIISDGDAQPAPSALLQRFVDNKVSISTVAVNPHPGDGQALGIMQSIAGVTGGRFYYPQDPNELPSIFIKEAKTLRRSMIQNKTFVAEYGFPSPILKGIEGLPPLHGLVLTTPKSISEEGQAGVRIVLKAPADPESETAGTDVDPVLVTWGYGVGRTAAFTSDLSANWARDWVQWPHYRAFVSQLVTAISRVREKTHLTAGAFASGSHGVVVVEDHHPEQRFLDVQARVFGPDGKQHTTPLKQVAPRRYQGRFELTGKGRYQVMAVGVGPGAKERTQAGLIVPYSPEYLRFRANPILLKSIADQTRGRVLTGEESGEELFTVPRTAVASTWPVFDWFLLALVCLVPLDVAVRRVQLDWFVIRGWLGLGRRGETDRTLSALLKRKAEVSQTLRPDQPVAPATIRPARPAPPRPDQPEPPAIETPEPPVDEAAMTTTERLLHLKRRRAEGEQPSDDEQTRR